MNKKYGYAVVPAWEYSIVAEEGISSTGGVCIFVEKNDAIHWGAKNSYYLMPQEVVDVVIGGSKQQIPMIELYTMFYLLSIDIELLEEELNRPLEMVADKDIPMVWFTKERIPTLCIIHTEQIPI